MKYTIKNCPAKYYEFIDDEQKCFLKDKKCKHISDCLLKQIVELCKDVKEKDPIVAERDKQTGEIISISGWNENPVYDFARKILNLLEIEEVNE